jgi:hypothetical protein
MIVIKNTDSQTWNWYALPKYSVDLTKAIAKGVVGPQSVTSCDPGTTVNLVFAADTQVAALCVASGDATVVFYNPFFGAWCQVS